MRNEEQAYWKVKIRLVWRGVRSTPMGAARKSETPQELKKRADASENKSIILCLKSGYRPSSLTGQFFSALLSTDSETPPQAYEYRRKIDGRSTVRKGSIGSTNHQWGSR